ncbi:GAF domain-containing sensor histidine kinase [Granulicella sibirica]|uniref:histidine kinase n=1 Tax=Granulicella sibirica TaxID=2479048 RepID=A0A4Q0SZV8_9BACT|nr:GAF domain-containing sensor histidine kinase [Granulicella sibirica]RXH56863.1 Diguanylate cyclase (GGDEF domain) with GAF sensor [Granulicella sibirica]
MYVSRTTKPGSSEEEARLAALKRYSVLDTMPEMGYDDVTRLASFICDTPISLVSLVDADRQWFKSVQGLPIRETPREESFCALTLGTAETLIVEDATADPRFRNNSLVFGDPNIRFYAGAPIVEPGGEVLGTVCVIDTKPRVLEPRQIAALEALARQVMTLLELRRTIDDNARAAAKMQTIEKLAAVGQLASAMSHEINNPLQSMTNLLYMADACENRADQQDYLRKSQEELARISQTVRQTLRFHQSSERAVPTRLVEVVESVLTLFRSRLEHASVEVKVNDTQGALLTCYKSDIHQAIANLVSNALDAVNGRPGGRIEVRVRTMSSHSSAGQGVRFTIADNGCGMDNATQGRLFEPFHSNKAPRGTGLGLWVVKGILEKHQASIHVTSRDRGQTHGTVFSIFFPLKNGCTA